MNVALVVLNMQKAFFNGASRKSMENASIEINAAIALFREHNKKVLWIQDEHKQCGNIKGTEGGEIIDALQPKEHEKRIRKHYTACFSKAEFDDYLFAENINALIVTGYYPQYSRLDTYSNPSGVTIHYLKDALAGEAKEPAADTNSLTIIEIIEMLSSFITMSELEKMIKEH